jgi:hypothetical protein
MPAAGDEPKPSLPPVELVVGWFEAAAMVDEGGWEEGKGDLPAC